MTDRERFWLLGTYQTPRIRTGGIQSRESRDGAVIVFGYSNARIL